MSIIVYQDVGTPIIPPGDLAQPVIDALGASLRQMRYLTPDFAGLYQDAAGTTPVTAVGQPVGLMLDRRFGLARGVELFTAQGFLDGWMIGSLSTIDGPDTASSTATIERSVYKDLLDVGQTYDISADISGPDPTTGQLGVFNSTSAHAPLIPEVLTTGVSTASGTRLFKAESGIVGVRFRGPGTLTVNHLSIREVPGNHASQATTTARPTLRSGPLRIDYDGVDDYLRTVFPDLGSDVTIARSIPGVGAQILTGQAIAAGNWDDNVDSCATLVIDRALTPSEQTLVTAFLNQQAGV